jgi:hypothetical protein
VARVETVSAARFAVQVVGRSGISSGGPGQRDPVLAGKKALARFNEGVRLTERLHQSATGATPRMLVGEAGNGPRASVTWQNAGALWAAWRSEKRVGREGNVWPKPNFLFFPFLFFFFNS